MSLWPEPVLRGNICIEVRQPPVGLRRRAEDLVSQTGIHRQPLRQFDVVLRKGREVRISLVSAEDASSRLARRHIAQPLRAAVLRRALPQQKVVEGGNLQQAIGLHRRVHIHLVPLELSSEAHVVPALGQRDRVLPDEGIRHLPLRGGTRIADREPADHHRRSVRRRPHDARRRALPDRLRSERILYRRRTVEPHVAKPRDVHQVRVEDVRVRQHKHRVAVQLIRAPARNVRRAVRRERQRGWRARIEESSGQRVLLLNVWSMSTENWSSR